MDAISQSVSAPRQLVQRNGCSCVAPKQPQQLCDHMQEQRLLWLQSRWLPKDATPLVTQSSSATLAAAAAACTGLASMLSPSGQPFYLVTGSLPLEAPPMQWLRWQVVGS